MTATYDHDFDPEDPAEQGTHGDRDVPKEERKREEHHERLRPRVRYADARGKPLIEH